MINVIGYIVTGGKLFHFYNLPQCKQYILATYLLGAPGLISENLKTIFYLSGIMEVSLQQGLYRTIYSIAMNTYLDHLPKKMAVH